MDNKKLSEKLAEWTLYVLFAAGASIFLALVVKLVMWILAW